MSSRAYTVRARWDEVSKTWWTDGEDIPGLCCQADSFEELIETVLALAPELLRDNGIEPAGPGGRHYRDRRAACDGVYRRLTALLREAGCRFERQGKVKPCSSPQMALNTRNRRSLRLLSLRSQ